MSSTWPEVVTSLEQVTPQWLTAVLSRSGALTRGAVAAFGVDAGRGNWSSNARLVVNYTAEAQGVLPRRLFLKMVDTDLGDGEFFGPSEADYYTRDYVDVPGAPLLRCYGAHYSEELRRYHVLLDDVWETHVNASEKEPTLAYGLALAEGLAALHAHWWGDERLAEAGAPARLRWARRSAPRTASRGRSRLSNGAPRRQRWWRRCGLYHERAKGREGTKRERHEWDASRTSGSPSRLSSFAFS